MKKLIAILLASALSLGLLAACGGNQNPQSSNDGSGSSSNSTPAPGQSSNPGAEKRLAFTWWGNQTRNERTQAILDLYSEQNPGVTFDPQFAEWGDYWN